MIGLEGARDYRLERLRDVPVYHHPLGPATEAKLARDFERLTGGGPGAAEMIEVGSRRLKVPKAAAASPGSTSKRSASSRSAPPTTWR